jgi:hypothetical protein
MRKRRRARNRAAGVNSIKLMRGGLLPEIPRFAGKIAW